jgi:hypothetical protein
VREYEDPFGEDKQIRKENPNKIIGPFTACPVVNAKVASTYVSMEKPAP